MNVSNLQALCGPSFEARHRSTVPLRAQDNVPAFDSRQAMAIVERNLGAPISAKFESFDPQPIAAASLGQV